MGAGDGHPSLYELRNAKDLEILYLPKNTKTDHQTMVIFGLRGFVDDVRTFFEKNSEVFVPNLVQNERAAV